MKVLQYGKIKPSTVKCSNCECVLEYLPDDIHADYIASINRILHYVECPICSKHTYVPYINTGGNN